MRFFLFYHHRYIHGFFKREKNTLFVDNHHRSNLGLHAVHQPCTPPFRPVGHRIYRPKILPSIPPRPHTFGPKRDEVVESQYDGIRAAASKDRQAGGKGGEGGLSWHKQKTRRYGRSWSVSDKLAVVPHTSRPATLATLVCRPSRRPRGRTTLSKALM